jgi:hypothetical protein
MTAAAELRGWVCDRKRARRRAGVVAAAFGRAKLTARARSDIEAALLAVGVEATPSLAKRAREDWLDVVAREPSTAVVVPQLSSELPSQLAAWHSFNWTGGDGRDDNDAVPVCEWLPCLKDTPSHVRQLIWSGAAVAGIVTFRWVDRPTGRLISGMGLRRATDRAGRPLHLARGRADCVAI